jgi:hypothetical protein
MSDRDYTDAEIAKARPLTPRVTERIREAAGLMRWSDGEVVPGSLADTFWNRDMPRLLRAVSNQDDAPASRPSE